MKVVLINPPSQYSRPVPSLGLAYLAGYLKANNHDAIIMDLWVEPLSDQIVIDRISRYNPALIGVPLFTTLYHETVKLAAKLKKLFPSIPIIAGGPHASALPKELLEQEKCIDLVAIGEGEITLVEVIESMITRDFEQIKGIAFRKRSEVIVNSHREQIRDLDVLPFPDLEQVDIRKYKSSPPYGWYGLPLMMITSRGCPGRCIFCCKSVFGNSLKTYSAERIVKEIQHWKCRLPIKEIRFYDDDFTLSKKRIFKLCDLLIEERINLPWSCTTRVDYLTKELLAKMKKAGLYLISLGVESGSERVLKSLRKDYRIEHIRNAFKWCNELNIATLGYFLVGNPDETVEEMKLTLKLQKEIAPSFSGWGILEVFPGSPLFEQPRRHPDIKLNRENGYRDFYRKDIEEKYLRNFCLKGMVKNYLSVNGAKSMTKYLCKTRNFSILKDHLWLKFNNYTTNR